MLFHAVFSRQPATAASLELAEKLVTTVTILNCQRFVFTIYNFCKGLVLARHFAQHIKTCALLDGPGIAPSGMVSDVNFDAI